MEEFSRIHLANVYTVAYEKAKNTKTSVRRTNYDDKIIFLKNFFGEI